MRQLWAPWRMEYVGGGERGDGCILCAVERGEQEFRVVERTALTFTVMNRFPYSSGHLMVVPRRHVPDLGGLDDEEAAAVMVGTRRALRALREALAPGGFNVGLNQGHAAGAGIEEHVHLHVVPRWPGDTNFMPVLADVKVLPEHMERTAERVRAGYAALGEG